jgi:hypothetical protein
VALAAFRVASPHYDCERQMPALPTGTVTFLFTDIEGRELVDPPRLGGVCGLREWHVTGLYARYR